MGEGTVDAIVLVGLPGAGKSTVGPLVARTLGWRFVDLDASIEREAGQSIAELFEAGGEAAFRERERRATVREGASRPVVVAAGGGWMLDPSNREALGRGTRVVYLEVSPEVAAARLGSGAALRPLLIRDSVKMSLRELLRRRLASYLQADHTLAVDSVTPDQGADLIVALASGQPGY